MALDLDRGQPCGLGLGKGCDDLSRVRQSSAEGVKVALARAIWSGWMQSLP